jgi:hypothetical protein
LQDATLSPSSTCQDLRVPNCYKASGRELGGCRLGWGKTPYMRQLEIGYILSSIVPRCGYNSRPTSSCTVMDPLGAQLIRRPGHLSECSGKDVLDESSSYILNFKCFLLYRANLILSCMQEYFCLVKGVSEEMDNIFSTRLCVK